MALSLKREFLRKTIHLSSFWIVALIWFLPRFWSIWILGSAAFIVLFCEYEAYREKQSFLSRAYFFVFGRILRDREKTEGLHYSGAPYVLLAALILVIVFPRAIAMFAISVLLISDTMAAIVGRSFGKHRLIGRKTWEGTIAFIISGVLIALLFIWFGGLDWRVCVVGVCCGCLGDLFNEQLHVDDNLSIPLLVALPFLM